MDTLHLALVVDRSGSMQPIADDMNGAIAQTLQTVFRLRHTTTIVDAWTFDGTVEHVAVGTSPEKVSPALVIPRGMTALNDAIGTAITTLLARGITVDDTTKVRLIIVTDGQENSSREYTRDAADYLIEQVKAAGWDVAFIGTEQALKAEPRRTATTDSLSYAASGAGVRNMSVSLASYAATGAYGEPAIDPIDIASGTPLHQAITDAMNGTPIDRQPRR